MLLCVILHRYVLVKISMDVFLLRITDLESGRVGEQVLHSYRFVKRIIKFEPFHIGLKISLQINLALLHQLHYSSRRERFGDRGYTEGRIFRIDRCLALHIGEAIAFSARTLPSFTTTTEAPT